MEFEPVIGLEIHAQLNTRSKIFSGAPTRYGAAANTQACAVDLGLPGVLPVLNEAVLAKAIRLGIALDAEVVRDSVFARKNYFYPDLPKGYQISQYDRPVVQNGRLMITLPDGTTKIVGVTRAHLEEDAGKSVHEGFVGMTGIDLNRAGTPLLEIVSEPELYSAEEAVAYMRAMHTLVRYLDICDGNMQEGSFRCDANVSVRPKGSATLGTRAEIKNINSFRFVERAIAFEIDRQIDLIQSGGSVVQETRLYDADRDETRSMRGKEDAHDYRYFPDPDLPTVRISDELFDAVSRAMPELPEARRSRFIDVLGLSEDVARDLAFDRERADYFEAVVTVCNNAKSAANWVTVELMGRLNKEDIAFSDNPVAANELGILVARIDDKTISGKQAKELFAHLWDKGGSTDALIEQLGLKQITDTSAIEAAVDAVIADNPEQVAQFREGKDKVLGFFVGQVMKATKGQANPQQVNELLRAKLHG